MERAKIKAGGESKPSEHLRGKSRTCCNIVVIGWGQGSASLSCIRSQGLFGDTEGGPYWIHNGLTVGEKLAEAAAEQAKSVSWWLKTNVAEGGGEAPSFGWRRPFGLSVHFNNTCLQ